MIAECKLFAVDACWEFPVGISGTNKAGPMSRNSWLTQNGLNVFFYGLFILFLIDTETEAETDRQNLGMW